MSSKKVLIDGHYGAVSLNIGAMISGRDDLEVIHLEDRTKFTDEQRLSLLNEADIVILCQSNKTVTETLPLISNTSTKVLDTSNAYRMSPQWAYGLPELSADNRRKIAQSRYVALPNPIATGAALLLTPLVKAKVMPPYHPLMINSVVGYTNGGSNMISLYESTTRSYGLSSARMYALDQTLMLQKELMHTCGLSYKPAISPFIDDYPSGALVTIPLHLRTLAKRLHSRQVWDYMARAYEHEPLIDVMNFDGTIDDLNGFLESNGMAGSNKMQIYVFGDNDICMLAARYDNLGKGGAGATIQCMNLMLGLDELTGVL
ncbi:MAG: N-acetyl-gamma-glutamyl-phosphate reductase [Oscillospiraceae bacterium]|nr:N-acetyl-gamma-glutamyl-phosphate reductase [Oscillospiraceae bacterium]